MTGRIASDASARWDTHPFQVNPKNREPEGFPGEFVPFSPVFGQTGARGREVQVTLEVATPGNPGP